MLTSIVLYDWFIYLLTAIYLYLVASSIIVVLSDNRNPIRSLAWVIALIFLPFIGIVFYLFLGRSPRTKHKINRNTKRRIMSFTTPANHEDYADELTSSQKQLVKLASSISISSLTVHNKLEVFSEGKAKFDALKRDLRTARTSIYLQYYIFSDDCLGQEIADILIAKAQEGVAVKVIYDHVGSFKARGKFFKRMRRCGVEAHPFFRVTFPQLANRINWRNHRKIVVIDEKIGYIGGMNIASRYIKGEGNGRVWRDMHFRVEGEIVYSLLASFAMDWSFMNQPLDRLVPPVQTPEVTTKLGIQFISSGPTETWDNISLCFMKAISSARKKIYIQTPYFLPTEALLQALQAAALAKVDVRIMMPRVSDSKMIRYASFSYISQCLMAGIKVYLYEPGMLHSKTMIIDDSLVTSGSTNFDFRSFENNFECNLLIYSKEANSKMRDIFFEDLEHCVKINLTDWQRRPVTQRMLESIVRLLAPIL